MVRILVERTYTDGTMYVEMACLSSDTKPTQSADGRYKYITGSLALEVDTGNVYGLDETGAGTWNKVAELGGGGSAGRSASTLSMTRPSLTLGSGVPTLDLDGGRADDLAEADEDAVDGGDER